MTRGQWVHRLPWSIVVLTVLLIALGWLGIARSEQLLEGSRHLLHRQIAWSVISLGAMLGVSVPSYRILARWSYPAFALSVVLLAVVYLFPPINGAQRWIRWGSIGIQPSEFVKLAFVLGLSRYLMHRDSYRQLSGLLMPLALVLVPMVLILREPDLGTALVFLPVLFVMLFAAGARGRHLAMFAVVALATLPLLWSQMSREQKSRVTALAHQTGPGESPSDDGFHLHQAKQMFALGGVWGTLITTADESHPGVSIVPEPHTDSISSVLAERIGLWGFGLLLLLAIGVVWRGLAVADATREPYGRLMAIGIASLLAVQVLINTGMLVGLLPITGLALPLVSYGGSSLLANCLSLGLLLNVGLRPGYEVAPEPFRFAD